jgi:hypothetical protein
LIGLCDDALAAVPEGTTASSWAAVRRTGDLLALPPTGFPRRHNLWPTPAARDPALRVKMRVGDMAEGEQTDPCLGLRVPLSGARVLPDCSVLAA